MDLRAHLLELLAPLGVGDEIGDARAPRARLVAVSTEVGFWLSFTVPPAPGQQDGAEVQIEVVPIGEGRFAARTSRYAISYRSEGGRNPIAPAVGLALCRAVADRVAQNEERVAQLATHEALEAPPPARVREVRVDAVLEAAGHGADRFFKLSPYAGCLIGCRYCYAQTPMSTLRRLERLPETPWGSYVDVRVNTAEVLTDELAKLAPLPIKFCPILSDPYQAVEARYEITRACLEAIAKAATVWPTLILTRSKLVTRDAELLASLPSAWVGASIPSIDDETRRHFEPRAASVAERLAALTMLRRAGVKTFAVVQPLLPGSIDALADALAEAVSSVSIDVLRGEEQAVSDFDDPRYAEARTDEWQRARAIELAAALRERNVPVWPGELPPELLSLLRRLRERERPRADDEPCRREPGVVARRSSQSCRRQVTPRVARAPNVAIGRCYPAEDALRPGRVTAARLGPGARRVAVLRRDGPLRLWRRRGGLLACRSRRKRWLQRRIGGD